jgi:hypothetical protein
MIGSQKMSDELNHVAEGQNGGEPAEPQAENTAQENAEATDASAENQKIAVTDTEDGDNNQDIEISDADDENDGYREYVPRLTGKQQTIWQIALGWAFGFGIWFSLALGAQDQENVLLRWLFLILFAVAMIGRNQIEKRTGVRLRVFMKHFLISLLVFLGVFIIYGVASGAFSQPLTAG